MNHFAVLLTALGVGLAVGAWHLPSGVSVGGLVLAVMGAVLLVDYPDDRS